jgi:hypothetical protein
MALFEILALGTNLAKRRTAEMLATGVGFMVTHFSIGNQGHDPSDPLNPITPDAAMQFPTDQILFPPKAISGVDQSNPDINPIFLFQIDPGEVVGYFSSTYLWATVQNTIQVEHALNQLTRNGLRLTLTTPPPNGFTNPVRQMGVPRFVDLPTDGQAGDLRAVLATGIDYYFNQQIRQWLPIQERFLFGIANRGRTLISGGETSEFAVGIQM